MSEFKKALVIDNGSDMIKAGFAGDDRPPAVFPCIVERPPLNGITIQLPMEQKSRYVGIDDIMPQKRQKYKCPIKNGIVISWDDMDKLWHYTFHDQLR